MITQPAAAHAARLIHSPSWRTLLRFFLLACFLLPRFHDLSAQITGAQVRNPITPVAALPSTCKPYSTVFLTTTNTAYICTATDTYTPLASGSSSGSGSGYGLPSPTGTPGYLFSNGTTVSWGNILTGGSGALDCTTAPGHCDVTSLVPLKTSPNTWTAFNDFSSGLLRIPESTIANLPAASANTGREFMVIDGASTCDTTTGGGLTRVLVESIGTGYVAPNCSTGGSSGGGVTSTSQLSDFTPAVSGTSLTVQPGRIRFGTMSCTNFTTAATAAISSMTGVTGVAKLYISSNCALVLQYPNSLSITWNLTGMTAQPVATPTVPSDAWYLAEVNIGPASAITAVSDKRAVTGKDPTLAGTGIVIDCTLGPCLASIDPAVVPTLGGANAYTGTQDASAASITKPARTVSPDPSGSCPNNNEVVLSTASGNLFSCLAGAWHATGGGTTSGDTGGGSSGGSSGGDSSTPLAVGGGDYVFGTPSYSSGGVGVASTGVGHSGTVWAFINKIPTSKSIDYNVTTAGGASSGLLFAEYTADLSTPLCISAVATGSSVTTLGAHSVNWASGPNVSAGVCTIPLGAATAFLLTTDDSSLAIATYGTSYGFVIANVNTPRLAGYAASNNLSTGTGSSLSFTSVSSITWSRLPSSNNFQPILFLEN